MKKYKIPETICLQVQNLGALCDASGNQPAPGRAGVQAVTMNASDTWS